MKFSPVLLSNLIIVPLRYFFSEYYANTGFRWDEDEKLRTVEVGRYYDFHKLKISDIPRVLVNRGTYKISKTSLTDNMLFAPTSRDSAGAPNRQNLLFIDGTATITIEARNLGTCEILADIVSHFITWTRPLICDTQGFKEFGLDCMVTEPQLSREDSEKFVIQISVPYFMEEEWQILFDGIKLKNIISTVTPNL